MKKRTKKYKPKAYSDIGGLALIHKVLYNSQNLSDDQLRDLGLANWASFTNLTTGNGTEDDWQAVTGALNMGAVLCERGVGSEYQDDLIKALEEVFRARIRGRATGQWYIEEKYQYDVRDGLAIHDEQCKLITRIEMINTILDVQKRVALGNVYTMEPCNQLQS